MDGAGAKSLPLPKQEVFSDVNPTVYTAELKGQVKLTAQFKKLNFGWDKFPSL